MKFKDKVHLWVIEFNRKSNNPAYIRDSIIESSQIGDEVSIMVLKTNPAPQGDVILAASSLPFSDYVKDKETITNSLWKAVYQQLTSTPYIMNGPSWEEKIKTFLQMINNFELRISNINGYIQMQLSDKTGETSVVFNVEAATKEECYKKIYEHLMKILKNGLSSNTINDLSKIEKSILDSWHSRSILKLDNYVTVYNGNGVLSSITFNYARKENKETT